MNSVESRIKTLEDRCNFLEERISNIVSGLKEMNEFNKTKLKQQEQVNDIIKNMQKMVTFLGIKKEN